jgi:dUTP pyrophosphatase
MEINIEKLHDNAVIPYYSNPGDAGMDLTATELISVTKDQVTYGTGLAMEIPYGYVGLIYPRSSIRKYNLELSNSVGVIDSGYRGEIQFTFNKTKIVSPKIYEIGDRIGQIIIVPYPQVKFNEVLDLNSTDRGIGGFGSTGN